MMAGLVGCYAAALLFETFDKEIKAALGFTGGHPLKHLAAAAGAAWIVWMLRRRAMNTDDRDNNRPTRVSQGTIRVA